MLLQPLLCPGRGLTCFKGPDVFALCFPAPVVAAGHEEVITIGSRDFSPGKGHAFFSFGCHLEEECPGGLLLPDGRDGLFLYMGGVMLTGPLFLALFGGRRLLHDDPVSPVMTGALEDDYLLVFVIRSPEGDGGCVDHFAVLDAGSFGPVDSDLFILFAQGKFLLPVVGGEGGFRCAVALLIISGPLPVGSAVGPAFFIK